MLQTIFTLFLFLGGVFMYFVYLLTFELRISNIYKVLGIILACIPVAGFTAYMIAYLCSVFDYQKDNFEWENKGKSIVRDLWINRFLFNDVDWEEYDAKKKEETERHAKELQIQHEKERRNKLVHGLSGTNPLQLEPIELVIEQN